MSEPSADSVLDAMQPFDETAACAKCGSTTVNARYEPNTAHYGCPIGRKMETSYGPEHIVRTCQRCHYGWEERVLTPAPNDGSGAALRQRSPETVRCYLCQEQRPKPETEVTRHEVPSATRGGTVSGVRRYVRMCRVGFGCRAGAQGGEGT